MRADNIRCNSVHPGIIATPIWDKIPTGAEGNRRNAPIDPQRARRGSGAAGPRRRGAGHRQRRGVPLHRGSKLRHRPGAGDRWRHDCAADGHSGRRRRALDGAPSHADMQSMRRLAAVTIVFALGLTGASALAPALAQGVAPGGGIGNTTGIGSGLGGVIGGTGPNYPNGTTQPSLPPPRHPAAMAGRRPRCPPSRPCDRRPTRRPAVTRRPAAIRSSGTRPGCRPMRCGFPNSRSPICRSSRVAGAARCSSTRATPERRPIASTTKASDDFSTRASTSRTITAAGRRRRPMSACSFAFMA